MATSWSRPTKINISRDAIHHNIKQQLSRMREDQELFAVIKADGYGHGAIRVAEIAQAAGAKGFCVATLDEAIELRHNGFSEPLLVMGVVQSSYVQLMLELDITVATTSLAWLKEADQLLSLSLKENKLKVHLKVDTGMGRLGFRDKEAFLEAVTFLKQSAVLTFDGVFTHNATADEKDTSYQQAQQQKYNDLIGLLDEKPRYVHSANSATALWHENYHSNVVRFGIAMYGLNPSGKNLVPPFELKPALSLTTELVHVKKVKKGSSISYGATYTAQQDEWIGTLPIGYADGWRRSLQGFHVLINGVEAELIGRICMDQCMIRLPEELPIGTLVTLVGYNHDKQIALEDVAATLDTINYEIACGFSERIPRYYR